MVKFNVGDIISLAYFPNQENSNKGTTRPVLIIEAYSDGYLVIPFTTKLHQNVRHPKSIIIKKESDIGKKMGIREDSLLIPERKFEIKKIVATPPVFGNCGLDFLEENDLF